MTKIKRIKTVIAGLITILMAFILIFMPQGGMSVIIFLIGAYLVMSGIHLLGFYSQLARYMVGGKFIMYFGFIMLSLGVFTITMAGEHKAIVILYLLILLGVAGGVDVFRGIEEKRNADKTWFAKFAWGITEVVLAILPVIFGFRRNGGEKVVIVVFALVLIYKGVWKIVDGFKKSAIIYTG